MLCSEKGSKFNAFTALDRQIWCAWWRVLSYTPMNFVPLHAMMMITFWNCFIISTLTCEWQLTTPVDWSEIAIIYRRFPPNFAFKKTNPVLCLLLFCYCCCKCIRRDLKSTPVLAKTVLLSIIFFMFKQLWMRSLYVICCTKNHKIRHFSNWLNGIFADSVIFPSDLWNANVIESLSNATLE